MGVPQIGKTVWGAPFFEIKIFFEIKYPALAGQDTKMEGFMKKFLSAILLMVIL